MAYSAQENLYIPTDDSWSLPNIISWLSKPDRTVKFAFADAQNDTKPNALVVNLGTNWSPSYQVIANHVLSGSDLSTENSRLSFIPKSSTLLTTSNLDKAIERHEVKKLVDGGRDLTVESSMTLDNIFGDAVAARDLVEHLLTSANDANNAGVTSNVEIFKTNTGEYCVSWTNGVNSMRGWYEHQNRAYFDQNGTRYNSEEDFVNNLLSTPEIL